MTDDQIRSRLREALRESLVSYKDFPDGPPLQEGTRVDLEQWLGLSLLQVVRDLLSFETQQIREERDAVRATWSHDCEMARLNGYDDAKHEAVAETQALREENAALRARR